MSYFKVDIYKWEGNAIFRIKNAAGFKVISFGMTKAKALLSCIDELREFVSSNGESGGTETIDLKDLTDEQKEALMALGIVK